MITLFLTLALLLPIETIYSGYLSYGNLQRVVERKGWQGTENFDILLATPNCSDMAKWAWVIVEDGQILQGLVVDCSSEWDDTLGLVADCNRWQDVHKFVFIVMRPRNE